MKKELWGALIVMAIAIPAGSYWWFSHAGQPISHDGAATDKAESSQEAVAPVTVAPVEKGAVAEEITVYGTIVPAAGAVQAITVPFESRVRRLFVTEGQQVSGGDPLLEIEPSPETHLQVEQTRNEVEAAKKALEYTQQRFELKLATNDQLLQTKQALEQAQAKLESMRRRGSENPRTIHADVASLISKLAVQEGAIVPAGNTMIERVGQNHLEARLGIEPEDSDRIKPGQEVALARVNAPGTKTVLGRIRKVSRAADTTTRLVQIFADLPSASRFLLGEYILGKVSIASIDGLIVPRSAVLPAEDHYVLFTIKDGHAQEHAVRVGLENEKYVQVIAKDLQPGEPVVTLGNYELKDGMDVTVSQAR
ncbi:MAG: efflux RND transporter periplasmic adaptor subunit [Deltaproteobacteria bacterium]|nr:MAG: efflux RND transporter periplasmic adaptor subunit [Deltaproteobacteria bacterium]